MLLISTSCLPGDDSVDLAVTGARMWTGNVSQPWTAAMAIHGDRIVAVGSDAEILALVNDETRIIEADGKMIVPGFIDSHVHFLVGGFRLSAVQLRDASTPAEFVRRVAEFAQTVQPGAWITGGDWDHELWGGELPSKAWIDSVTPDNPVWLYRLDGHMALANTAALVAAGIDPELANPTGGTIVRDNEGAITGIFKDNAAGLIGAVVPDPPEELKQRALAAATEYVAAQGVTMLHHVGTWDDLGVFERAHSARDLNVRIYASVPLSSWEQLRDTIDTNGRGDAWLKIGGLKGFVDGSLGSHTAVFFDPFTDEPADTGLMVNSPDDLYRWASGADSAGLQLLIHAIGDRAINLQLDIFERVASENGNRDRRFRIEHAQHIDPADFARFADLGVIASVQPYHAIDDGRWAERVIGPERIKTTYAFRSLLDAGARVAFGSDWFVAPPVPLEGIYAAVTRRTIDGANPGGWVPEQKISVDEALRAYTIDAAYASFDEENLGSLEPGKLADFVMIDRDLTAIPPEQIRDARVVMTVIGGETVFSRE